MQQQQQSSSCDAMAMIIGLWRSYSLAFVFADVVVPVKNDVAIATPLYTIEGYILPPNRNLGLNHCWLSEITLAINGGQYKGFVRTDGRFLISGVPYGSHVVEVYHPDIYFRPVRVEINAKGKYRARALSYVEPGTISQIAYPLRLPAAKRRQFFTEREQWRFVDFILNPMVLIMLAPVLMLMIVPRIIRDPQTKRELENLQFPKVPNNMPDLSDMLTSLLSAKPPTPIPEKTAPKQICKSCNTKQNKKKR
ncbi:ER membrane protein complex subunit 7 homolog [Drosophila subobscura]|uniref:ER membrane protein complex subunit 7 homolog n=1 Tax=Drosophila subobscura TaxID=7241 RepID=UPI00155B2EA5|nr:ER membrane protein complex subunit 7 homolog [Drosophila subobscura]